MLTFLEEQRRQYQIFLNVTERLLEAGYGPLATEPYRQEAFRTDHTPAILEVVASFSPDTVEWPLKVFSTGPLFLPGRSRWTEAIDAEWVGPIGASEQRQVLDVVNASIDAFSSEGLPDADLTMVFGEVQWLRKLAESWGLSDDEIQDFVAQLKAGRLAAVDGYRERAGEAGWALLRPQPTTEFFSQLRRFVPEAKPPVLDQNWRSLWDLSLTGQRAYHTGLVFALHHDRTRQALISGGRFDLNVGGRTFSGMGFTVNLDAVREALREAEHVL